MSYRRRHRWFRRMALGMAFASVLFAGRVSVAAAKFDEGSDGSRYVTAGGWSGPVDMESGIPLSAGIPNGDEQFIDPAAVQVIPYLSHGVLTEADAQAAAAEVIHDPYTGESLAPQQAPDNRVERTLEQGPPVISYLSHGMTSDDVVGARPDDMADRFAHSDVPTGIEVSNSGSTVEWNDALTVGIGALVLALGLGLALGYLRRPRLAGL